MAISPRASRPSASGSAHSPPTAQASSPGADPGGLRRLAVDVLRAVGAEVEEVTGGPVDVLLPESQQARLGGAGFLRLAFDPDVAAADPEVQYVAVGSPLTERIVALGQQLGVAARWHVNGLRWSSRHAISPDRWRVKLTNARFRPSSGVEMAFACHHMLVHFRVAYVSDERREELRTVVVDASSSQSAPLLQRIWESLPDRFEGAIHFPESLRPPGASWPAPISLAPRPESQFSDTDLLPDAQRLAALYRRAGELLRTQIAGTLGTYRRRAARRLDMERLRIEAFYDDTEAELRRRLARVEIDERRGSIELKLEANRLDREHKLADIAARHRLRVVVTPLSAAYITQPKVRMRLAIENRYASAELPLVLDPLTGQLELPTCQSCQESTESVHLCANGHVACDGCVRLCAFCQREHCRDCGVGTCAVCGRAACARSQVVCPTCGKTTCDADRNRCH